MKTLTIKKEFGNLVINVIPKIAVSKNGITVWFTGIVPELGNIPLAFNDSNLSNNGNNYTITFSNHSELVLMLKKKKYIKEIGSTVSISISQQDYNFLMDIIAKRDCNFIMNIIKKEEEIIIKNYLKM